MKRNSKLFGFTLAEVLITLAVIGVVAAMSIPALIGSTNQQEFKVALKKAVAVLNQALTMSIALDATDAAACTNCANSDDAYAGQALADYFRQRLNVIADGPTKNSFYTADGMQFTFIKNDSNPCGSYSTESTDWTAANCVVLVDVNGSKNPSALSTGTGTGAVFKDQYYLIIRDQNVVASGNSAETVAQDAMGY